MLEPFTLEGSIVRLEPLATGHLGGLVAAASESRESHGLGDVPTDEHEMRDYVTRALDERSAGRQLPFATCWRDSGRVAGTTRFHDLAPWRWPRGSPFQREEVPDAAEIGATWLAGSAQRTGLNTEAKLLMLTHAFETWKVHRVRLRTDERNHRSRDAIERLGAHLDGILRADRPATDDLVRNSALYSILAPEWPSARIAILERLARHQKAALRASEGP